MRILHSLFPTSTTHTPSPNAQPASISHSRQPRSPRQPAPANPSSSATPPFVSTPAARQITCIHAGATARLLIGGGRRAERRPGGRTISAVPHVGRLALALGVGELFTLYPEQVCSTATSPDHVCQVSTPFSSLSSFPLSLSSSSSSSSLLLLPLLHGVGCWLPLFPQGFTCASLGQRAPRA